MEILSFNIVEIILLSVMISAGIIALATYYMGAYVIPRSSTKRLEFTEKYIRRQQTNFASNVQLEVGKGVIAYIENYQREEKTGMNFSLDKFEGKKLVSHLTASSISYDSTYTKKSRWTIHHYMIRQLVGMREKITHAEEHIYNVNLKTEKVKQITTGQYDYDGVSLFGKQLIAKRHSMSCGDEIYAINPATGATKQLTFENKHIYDQVEMGRVEERWIKTTDGKDMYSNQLN